MEARTGAEHADRDTGDAGAEAPKIAASYERSTLRVLRVACSTALPSPNISITSAYTASEASSRSIKAGKMPRRTCRNGSAITSGIEELQKQTSIKWMAISAAVLSGF